MSDQPTRPSAPVSTHPVPLRNPVVAGVLAFLLPGLGHYYQGRLFKAVLYCVCVLGTFFTGLRIGHGQVVYFQWDDPETRTYAYLCQVWTGLPALPALAQAKLRKPQAFDSGYLADDFSAFLTAHVETLDGELRGKLSASPDAGLGRGGEARFEGTLRTSTGETAIQGTVTGCRIDPQVAPERDRLVTGYFEGRPIGQDSGSADPLVGPLTGSVPRPLWDWYQAPLFDADPPRPSGLDRAHRALGSRFELGVVYTMIAGLLNVLAIFDAMYGPAYGDEEHPGPDSGGSPSGAGAAPKVPS